VLQDHYGTTPYGSGTRPLSLKALSPGINHAN